MKYKILFLWIFKTAKDWFLTNFKPFIKFILWGEIK